MQFKAAQVKRGATIEVFPGVLVDDRGDLRFRGRDVLLSLVGLGAIAFPDGDGMRLARGQIVNVAMTNEELAAVIVRGDFDGQRFSADRSGDVLVTHLPMEHLRVVNVAMKQGLTKQKVERIMVQSIAIAVSIDPIVEIRGSDRNGKIKDRMAIAERIVDLVLDANERNGQATAVDTATLRNRGWTRPEPDDLEFFVSIDEYYTDRKEQGLPLDIPAGSALAPADGAADPAAEVDDHPEAGWYPDHREPTRLRWWDGAAWTADTVDRPVS